MRCHRSSGRLLSTASSLTASTAMGAVSISVSVVGRVSQPASSRLISNRDIGVMVGINLGKNSQLMNGSVNNARIVASADALNNVSKR